MKIHYQFTIWIIVPLLFLLSCSRDDTAHQLMIESKLEINIDGTDYTSNEMVYGNENCQKVYVKANYFKEDEESFSIEFAISKDGNLLGVKYEERPISGSGIRKLFLTPNFNPLSTFNISNFIYNPTTGEVSFNFNGTVFYENDNEIVRNIYGKYKVHTLRNVDCTVPDTGIYYDGEDIKLFSYTHDISRYNNQAQEHRFFSNNGFAIYLHTAKDLSLYPSHEIIFNENDPIDRVDFKEVIGPIIADQLWNVDDLEWKNYETSGKIIIENTYIEKGQNMISGKLNLLVKDHGQVVYTLNDIEFKTLSF